MSPATRREILRCACALSTVGAAASTFGFQLATMGEAAAQTAPSGYKALVCMFLYGGNDAHNTLLATDADSWSRYSSAREAGALGSIALQPVGTPRLVGGGAHAYEVASAWGGVQPVASTSQSARSFALHPHLAPLVPIWEGGRAAAVANVGPLIVPTTRTQFQGGTVRIPAALMSHNDQQSTWQAGAAEGARRGWGGLMADQFLSANGTNSVFTAISTAGNAVMLSGENVVQFQMSTNQSAPAMRFNSASSNNSSAFGVTLGSAARATIRDTTGSSFFMQDHASKVIRSQDFADLLNAQFASTGPSAGIIAPPPFIDPTTSATTGGTNPLAVQMQTVAKVIASNAALGIKRQVFFVSIGGFDTHSGENLTHGSLMGRIGHALAYFDSALQNVNGTDMRSMVTTFTASDFGRTMTSNGDGSDHGWGAHHFIMGGAVRGRNVYGTYPTIGIDRSGFSNPDLAYGNILIPTTSVDQMGGTLGKWFGLSDSQLDFIFPNLKNFSTRDMGFMNP
jgi:uncharacterized protein (DUF1501 family)